MLPRKSIITAVLLVGCGGLSVPETTPPPARAPTAEDREASLATGTWVSPEGTRVRFAILVPPINPGERVPLVLALHGLANPDSVSAWYGPRTLESLFGIALRPLGAIIIAPDAPRNNWTDPVAERATMALVDEIKRRYPIDERRTMVTGVDMGGMGAWFLAHQQPKAFRVVVPLTSFPLIRKTSIDRVGLAAAYNAMVSDASSAWAEPFRGLPVYAIHSRQDENVPFLAESTLVSRINARGGYVHFAKLDSLKHNPARAYGPALRAAIPWIRRQWDRP